MKIFVSIPHNSAVFRTFVTEDVKVYLEKHFDVEYSDSEHALTAEEFKARVKDCDAVITGWGHTKISYDMLCGSNVKLIAHTGGSIGDTVDMSLYDNGIRILSGNSIYAESVAEGTIAYMLTALRRLPYYINEVRNGGWHGNGFFNESLLDKTVGIIGLGAISRYVIKMLQIFRADIKIYSSHTVEEEYLRENNAKQVSLEEIFSTCDIVSVHTASNAKTLGMIGREHFDLLRDGVLFVNTARGAVIREEEMIAALKEKRFCAILDVFCLEPLSPDSALRRLENVYCVPHMGGPTLDRRAYVTKKLAEDIIRTAKGEKPELEIPRSAAGRMTVYMGK